MSPQTHQTANRIYGEATSLQLHEPQDSGFSGPIPNKILQSVRIACDLWLAKRAKEPGALYQPGTRNF